MDQEQSEQVGSMSDHEKFGETGSFGSASTRAPRVFDKADESAASVRERAVQMKAQLADKLETGAGRLRQRVAGRPGRAGRPGVLVTI